ncbi:putative metallophosphoesterase [Ruminiclostridium hungatei]|uniref:Putative metallophosphoesterase n=1 Tax=Ruminiclostridium hungatei TaxID=48256 RepID=A0A1V4SI49_RUMHU|nr:metallophosphoesterase [Ruminiclostridium hungatei]OPX43176.1 putative metallophosphoesterase [Ruminiclostridium hungatei]
MRGINPASTLLLLTFIWNLAVFIFSKAVKPKLKKKINSGITALIILLSNLCLVFALVYFSTVIGVSHYMLESRRIPAEFDGFKILQISDFHTGTFHGGTKALIQKSVKEKPDIIAITGDLIDEDRINTQPVKELAAALVKVAPVYFVSGNHDVWYNGFEDFEKMLENLGVQLLDNRQFLLQRGGAGIMLFGIRDPNSWNDLMAEAYLKEKLGAFKPGEGFNILLYHRANMFELIKGKGFQLVLSGHMHGGQVQLPFIGGLVSPQQKQRWFPDFTDGRWNAEGTTMIVSRGLGNNAPVPRMFNPPELVAVTLKSTEEH